MEAVASTMSQLASARKRSFFNIAMVRCLASFTRATAVDIVLQRAADISLIPKAFNRYFVVVAFNTNVKMTIPAV